MSPSDPDRGPAYLQVPGELATLIRTHDWRGHEIGTPDQWPQSLRTVLQIMLTSRYAMWMAWGPNLTFFCNDAYRPTLGAKVNWLGSPAETVWSEIWDDIGPRIEHVIAHGEATWDEALLLFLERNGFVEETYHTFSYSPLADDGGEIDGMLCVVTEVTGSVIGDRRLQLLGALALNISGKQTGADVWDGVRTCLEAGAPDLPLVEGHVFDGPGGAARLVLSTGTTPGTPAVEPMWPLDAIRRGAAEFVVEDRRGVRSSVWNRACTHALVAPVASAGLPEPIGAFVAGLNPFRPFDDDYRSFLELLVGQIAASLAAANAFEDARRRAEALAAVDQAKTTFFSNVSHEFRTPLTLMLGPLEDLLFRDDVPAEQRAQLDIAHRNSLRLLRLVNSLLDFSRIESGRTEAVFRPTDLPALTSELASSFRSATDKAGLALVVDAPPLSQPVFVDRDMWEKVVLNLLSNAFKFTFSGEIGVSLLEGDDGYVRLTVRDTGTGIPANELPRVFERFHRVEGSRGRSFEGSGIGLALVQELVRQHGGEIRVESRLDHGTAFIVQLPLGSAHLPAGRVLESGDAGVGSTHSRGYVEEALRWLPGASSELPDEILQSDGVPAQRILIADDNADLRGYIGRLLGDHGYLVDTAADGLDALARLRERRPDLLMTDAMMPGLDGVALITAIRADAALFDLPIIMLSARAGEESQIEGLAAGADDYLTKPFSARELLARIAGTIKMVRLRREAAEKIRATEARGAAVLQGMAEGYVLVDRKFTVHQMNAEGLRNAEADAESVVGRPFAALFPWATGAAQMACLRTAMTERCNVTLEDIRVDRGFGEQWIEIRAYPAADGLAVFLRDVSDRKRVEHALHSLNDTLEQQVALRTRERDRTWNLSQDLLVVCGTDGIFHAVNPAWTSVLGLEPSDVVGRHFLELIHPDDHAVTRTAHAIASSGRLRRFENRLLHDDGSIRWISWQATHDGDTIYASGRDVTAEKEGAAELAMAQDQLRQSQKMEAVGQLTGGLAHDFNNLLTAISGSLELLQLRIRKGEHANLDRYVNAAQGAASRAAALTHRLLAFSRRQTLDPKPTDVNRLILDIEDLVRRTVGPSIEIDVIGAEGLWPALVDRNQLESALLNLCINARDAMPDGGRLTIETANASLEEGALRERDLAPGQYLSLCVTDTGTGMSDEVKQRAFDPFFTTKPLGSGTGLGLSMVYGFARQSGGHVRIDTEIGQGTTITIYLPRHSTNAAIEYDGVAIPPPPIPATGNGQTVLVVDDEPAVRMLIVEVLEAMGCRIVEAEDGASGLRILQSGARVDLLVTDVGLPGGTNGRQVADAGRALHPDLGVLFITGYAENAAFSDGILETSMQVLTKPFTIDALSHRIRDLLRAHAEVSSR